MESAQAMGNASVCPSVPLVYDIALNSYEVAERRRNMAEGRIQKVLTFTATLTFAAPVLVRSLNQTPNFGSPLFLSALSMFVLIMALGMYALTSGTIITLDPKTLHDHWLDLAPSEFQKQMIENAGKHYDINVSRIDRKGQYTNTMAFMFVVQAVLFAAWAASNLG